MQAFPRLNVQEITVDDGRAYHPKIRYLVELGPEIDTPLFFTVLAIECDQDISDSSDVDRFSVADRSGSDPTTVPGSEKGDTHRALPFPVPSRLASATIDAGDTLVTTGRLRGVNRRGGDDGS